MLCCDAYTKVLRIFNGYSLAFLSFLFTAQLHCHEQLNLLYTKPCKNFSSRFVSPQFLRVNALEGSYWGKPLKAGGTGAIPPTEAAGMESREPRWCSAQPRGFLGAWQPRPFTYCVMCTCIVTDWSSEVVYMVFPWRYMTNDGWFEWTLRVLGALEEKGEACWWSEIPLQQSHPNPPHVLHICITKRATSRVTMINLASMLTLQQLPQQKQLTKFECWGEKKNNSLGFLVFLFFTCSAFV